MPTLATIVRDTYTAATSCVNLTALTASNEGFTKKIKVLYTCKLIITSYSLHACVHVHIVFADH